MNIVGRREEQELIEQSLLSNKPEFVVVYGRRRVGKTYLIKEYFNNSFAFYATGAYGLKTRDQLKLFNLALVEHGSKDKTIPKDWFEAFARLKQYLCGENVPVDPVGKRKVVFLDELPWMDTARSDFKSALDHFWNSFASSQKDILLIVCGSATSWIINNILSGKGGFYNRITRQIHLKPFSLGECEELCEYNGIVMSRAQHIESYMVFGGIPYYLTLFDKRLSLAQNINELLFNDNGQLYYEYDRLFESLFKNPRKHISIINALAKKNYGMTRVDLSKIPEIGDGDPLTRCLLELEQCGFIRKYKNYTKEKTGFFYQIIDPFILFCIRFIADRKINSWLNYEKTPSYYAWSGNAFEVVCLNHVAQIKAKLGITGVETAEYSWRSKESENGAQIDLLLDRKDDMINICEIKHTESEYEITSDYEKNLANKVRAFREETGTKKAVHVTMISASGLKKNEYSNCVQSVVTGDDLFMKD